MTPSFSASVIMVVFCPVPPSAAPVHRVRRGIVDDCCWNKCLDSQVKQYCTTKPADARPGLFVAEEQEPHSSDFHSPVIEAASSPEVRLESTTVVAPAKSRVMVGRVPHDYVNTWTYAG